MNPNQTTTPMSRTDAEILHALNLLTPDLSSMDAFVLAGKVVCDRTVLKRTVLAADGTYRAEILTTMEVLEEMTDAEKLLLRERVLGHATA
jgi:hypothetical protein